MVSSALICFSCQSWVARTRRDIERLAASLETYRQSYQSLTWSSWGPRDGKKNPAWEWEEGVRRERQSFPGQHHHEDQQSGTDQTLEPHDRDEEEALGPCCFSLLGLLACQVSYWALSTELSRLPLRHTGCFTASQPAAATTQKHVDPIGVLF